MPENPIFRIGTLKSGHFLNLRHFFYDLLNVLFLSSLKEKCPTWNLFCGLTISMPLTNISLPTMPGSLLDIF